MQNGDYEQAEQVFQADLERNQRNGRSLFGFFNSVEAQGNNSAVHRVKIEFDIAMGYKFVRKKI